MPPWLHRLVLLVALASLSSFCYSPILQYVQNVHRDLGFRQQFETILDEIKYNSAPSDPLKPQRVEQNKGKSKLASNAYHFNTQRIKDDISSHKLGLARQQQQQQQQQQLGSMNATLLMLVRNWELEGALASMRSLEDRFNHKYKYPWTFLNDVPFTEEFIEATTLMASGRTQYGLIPADDWNRPSWINTTKFEENLQNSQSAGILYGNSRSYRNMCRFNSGFFYKQKLLDQFDWYFRVEPDVQYFCDFQYDPFQLLSDTNKIYGFVISLYEYEDTIPTLWNTTMDFLERYPQHLHPNNSLGFITDTSAIGPSLLIMNRTTDYNLCHFWSNFEIANLNFFRSQQYNDFFNHLDKAGGFYYERWGDAPVHTLGLALLADREKIHHFEDIGYRHNPFESCPSSKLLRYKNRCVCNPEAESNMDVKLHSCLPRWWKLGAGKKFLSEV